MEIYDEVAEECAGVFDDIRLRRFEWPWLESRVLGLKPRSLLDAGLGRD
jgi:hypothetical protein